MGLISEIDKGFFEEFQNKVTFGIGFVIGAIAMIAVLATSFM